eukprot:scaffold316963_cov22-Tisochrysis_lutea.AAC.1
MLLALLHESNYKRQHQAGDIQTHMQLNILGWSTVAYYAFRIKLNKPLALVQKRALWEQVKHSKTRKGDAKGAFGTSSAECLYTFVH